MGRSGSLSRAVLVIALIFLWGEGNIVVGDDSDGRLSTNTTIVKKPNEVYDRHYGGSTKGYPKDTDYIVDRILPHALPGIVLAVITIIIGICFCTWRMCVCKCCPSPITSTAQYCCGVNEVPPGGYPAKDRMVLKITLVVLFALVISAAVVGWHGNKGVSNEMDEVVDNLLLAVNYLHTKGVTITGTLLNLSDALVHIAPSTSKDLKRYATKVTDITDKLEKQPKKARKTIKNAAKWRTNVFNISFVVAIGLIAIGLIGAMANFPALAMTMCILAFVCLVFCWISTGIHSGLSVFLDDTCLEINTFLRTPNQRMMPSLDELIDCPEVEELTEGYAIAIAGVSGLTTQWVNAEAVGLPSIGLEPVVPQYTNSSFPRYYYPGLQKSAMQFQARLNTSVGQLNEIIATTTNQTKKTTALTLKDVIAFIFPLSDLTRDIGFIDSCYFVRWLMAELYWSLCQDPGGDQKNIIYYFIWVYVAYSIIGVIMIATIVIGSKSSNMWDADNWDENSGAKSEDEHSLLDDNKNPKGEEVEDNPVAGTEKQDSQPSETSETTPGEVDTTK